MAAARVVPFLPSSPVVTAERGVSLLGGGRRRAGGRRLVRRDATAEGERGILSASAVAAVAARKRTRRIRAMWTEFVGPPAAGAQRIGTKFKVALDNSQDRYVTTCVGQMLRRHDLGLKRLDALNLLAACKTLANLRYQQYYLAP